MICFDRISSAGFQNGSRFCIAGESELYSLPIIRGIAARKELFRRVIWACCFVLYRFALCIVAVPEIKKQAACFPACAGLPLCAQTLRINNIL